MTLTAGANKLHLLQGISSGSRSSCHPWTDLNEIYCSRKLKPARRNNKKQPTISNKFIGQLFHYELKAAAAARSSSSSLSSPVPPTISCSLKSNSSNTNPSTMKPIWANEQPMVCRDGALATKRNNNVHVRGRGKETADYPTADPSYESDGCSSSSIFIFYWFRHFTGILLGILGKLSKVFLVLLTSVRFFTFHNPLECFAKIKQFTVYQK